jgi:hypothetical protein
MAAGTVGFADPKGAFTQYPNAFGENNINFDSSGFENKGGFG